MKDKKRHDHRSDEIDASHVDNPDVHHEVSDVQLRPILLFGVGLIIATVVIYLAMLLLFNVFDEREKKLEGKESPFAAERSRIPPEPRLYLAPKELGQPRPNLVTEHPFQEYKKLQAEENAKLNYYNWVDQNAGIVTIPIEEAKRLVLQRGMLVSRPAPVQSSAGAAGTSDGQQQSTPEELPSESSAGQKTEKKNQ
jgi:hypothetical protein